VSNSFRGVTAATGWVATVLRQSVEAQPRDTALGAARVLHSEQDEVRVVLPTGDTIVVTIHTEKGDAV